MGTGSGRGTYKGDGERESIFCVRAGAEPGNIVCGVSDGRVMPRVTSTTTATEMGWRVYICISHAYIRFSAIFCRAALPSRLSSEPPRRLLALRQRDIILFARFRHFRFSAWNSYIFVTARDKSASRPRPACMPNRAANIGRVTRFGGTCGLRGGELKAKAAVPRHENALQLIDPSSPRPRNISRALPAKRGPVGCSSTPEHPHLALAAFLPYPSAVLAAIASICARISRVRAPPRSARPRVHPLRFPRYSPARA